MCRGGADGECLGGLVNGCHGRLDPSDRLARHVSNGLYGSGSWGDGGLSIAGDISQSDDVWTYVYTVNTGRKAISHALFVVTQDEEHPFTAEAGSDAFEGARTWNSSRSNPGMPNDLYGVMFDFGDDNCETIYTLVTTHAPVWRYSPA